MGCGWMDGRDVTGKGTTTASGRRRTGKKRVESTKDHKGWSYSIYGCALGPAHGLGVTLTVTRDRDVEQTFNLRHRASNPRQSIQP
jgi:hypothetical protein